MKKRIKTFGKDNNNRASKALIEEAEKNMRCQFPTDYKEFLNQYNGVNLYTNSFTIRGTNLKSNLFRLSSLEEVINSFEYLNNYETIHNLIPIGDTLGDGIFIAMSVRKDCYGKIYMVSSDLKYEVQADSFGEFLDQIVYESKTMKDLSILIQEFKKIKENTEVFNFSTLFDEKLLEIFELGTPQIIDELLLCFDDEFEYAELMFNIIHTIETFETAIYVERVITNLEKFHGTAPEWASMIHIRILNSTPTFNAYRNALKKATLKDKYALNFLLNRMLKEEEETAIGKKIKLLLTDIQ